MSRKSIDLAGERRGKLRILNRAGRNEKGQILWEVQCDCGNVRKMTTTALSHAKSCGCVHPKDNFAGKRFGRWVVKEQVDSSKTNGRKSHRAYLCVCDCGTEKVIPAYSLKHNMTKSCGCLRKESLTTHNLSNTRLFAIWSEIKYRCNNKECETYKLYHDKGITICEEWENDFQTFYDWSMENGYQSNLTIDRIDNNKGYSPDNCRWTTNKVQMNNQDKSIRIFYNNEWLSVSDVAEIESVSYNTIYSRVKRGKYEKRKLYEEQD